MGQRLVRGMAGVWVLLAAVALGLAPAAQASSVTATSWIELDGSGTHDGLSRSATGVRILERNVAVAVDPDGDPVVAYVEAPSGNVIVKQLIFGAWRQLGTPPGQGVTPRVKVHTDGTVNVAWLGPTAVFLARWTGVAWVGLAGSNTGTGLTGPVNPLSFDFALDQAGNPVVALDAPPASGNDCLATGTVGLAGEQIYVVQWDGVAWNYLGSDPTGSGASNALSFQIPGTSQAVCHSAVMPSVVVDSSGAPVVAFVYTTGSNAPSPPATFYIGTNSDVYAARWDGAGWLGVGPAVPTQPVGAGLGQAGGISANANASAPPGSPVAPATPSIANGSDNRPVVAWSDNSADPNQTRVLLRKFSQDVRTFNIATAVWAMIGTNTSTSTVISPTSGRNELPVVAIGESDRPLVAWQTIGPTGAASVYIRRFNGTTGFIDVTTGSASGTGVNGPDVQGLAPALAVGPATAFTPILAWLGNGTSDPQVFARELGTGAMSTLSVTLTGGGAGTVTSLPSGISCPTLPGECSQVFPTGSEVTLTATPEPGLTFGGWSGACTNPTGPCVVTLTATKTVTANFVGAKLTVNVNGSGSGIAVSAPGGIACGLDCSQAFASNSIVTVTATAFAGSSFGAWSGCGTTSGVGHNICQVTMSSAKTITATFSSSTLTVVKTGSGSGTVTGTAPGGGATSAPINCGSICQSSNAVGTTLGLTATPDPGSTFVSWAGCTTISGATCSATMTSSRTATVNFTTARLTVNKAGTGTGTVTGVASPPGGTNANINCGTTCISNNANNTSVVLTAVPAADSSFLSWSGCTSVNGATCTVTMTSASAARTVTANFSSVTLKVAKNGTGKGTVVGTDPGALIDCGTTCTQKFPPQATVHLQANNTDPTSAFTGWTGCTSTAGNVCTVLMLAAKTVTATFASNVLKVTLSRVGGASGTVTGVGNGIDCGQFCQTGFPPNAQGTLTATPAPGSVFTKWTGCTQPTGATCTVTMNVAKTVTATFTSTALRVNITGAGTIASTPPGISCTLSCTGQFEPNTTVQLTPTPASTSAFTSWVGCASTVGNVCTVTMNVARTVTATFSSRRLTVTKTSVGGGAGIVDGPAFSCGQVCFQDFPPNTPVTVTATPDSESGFGGWKGCASTSGPGGIDCNVTMSAARTVTATFSKVRLTVIRSGNGTVQSAPPGINCPSLCAASFAAGQSVVLTAAPGPNQGVTFTGCATVVGNTCTVTMSQAGTVTVVFASFTLTVRKTGVGTGSITSDIGGINCTATCSAAYPAGTTVTLTATPAAGSSFVSFTGCTAGPGNTCTVVMTSAKTVSGAFQVP